MPASATKRNVFSTLASVSAQLSLEPVAVLFVAFMHSLLVGDQKTTIAAYRTNMAKFDTSDHPFVALKAGGSVIFRSSGNFMSEQKNAGVTFWVATGCNEYGKCSWNEDRTEGAVLEWNM